jgi:pyridoxal phosphate enzyme (YggS family)
VTDSASEISNNLLKIKTLISGFEKKYHRPPDSVKLLCASKGQSILKMMEAVRAGQRCFGENYVQEALKKMIELQGQDIEWHLIGPIQSNKIPKVAAHFHWVETVDDKHTAERLNAHRPTTMTPLNCLIQVNISDESTKSGAKQQEVIALAEHIASLPQLKLRGLMAIPALHKTQSDQRRECHKLHALWQSLRDKGFSIDTLSMGMSDDFEAAIAEGSTEVRIGTAILGART